MAVLALIAQRELIAIDLRVRPLLRGNVPGGAPPAAGRRLRHAPNMMQHDFGLGPRANLGRGRTPRNYRNSEPWPQGGDSGTHLVLIKGSEGIAPHRSRRGYAYRRLALHDRIMIEIMSQKPMSRLVELLFEEGGRVKFGWRLPCGSRPL